MATSEKRTVMVTGSEGYIGKELVKAFIRNGDHVIRVDCSDPTSSSESLSSSSSTFYKVDLSSSEEISELWEKVLKEHNTVNVLVNNAAAGGFRGEFHEQDMTAFNDLFHINVTSPFSMMQYHIRSLLSLNQSGHIINIASVAGMKPFPLSSGYGASKAALIALTQSAAKEYASRGINVNSISPGALERPNVKGWSKSELDAMPTAIPQGRACKPAEVANLAVFLASDAAKHMVGHNLVVDGGAAL